MRDRPGRWQIELGALEHLERDTGTLAQWLSQQGLEAVANHKGGMTIRRKRQTTFDPDDRWIAVEDQEHEERER